jgi:hypothetical protein
MNLTLREKLKLSALSTEQELQDTCNKYYLIYKNVYETTQNSQVREIARERISDLEKSAKNENITLLYHSNINFKGDSCDDSSIELMLNRVDDSGKLLPAEAKKIEEKINNLPESARKYFLKCSFVKNTKEMSIETGKELISLISNANKQDPSNFIYRQILGDIERSVDKYNNDLEVWNRSEQERIQHEKNIATTKKVFGVIGKILLGILSAIGIAIAGIFALCCESCDC